jgi:hypothetical protein
VSIAEKLLPGGGLTFARPTTQRDIPEDSILQAVTERTVARWHTGLGDTGAGRNHDGKKFKSCHSV